MNTPRLTACLLIGLLIATHSHASSSPYLSPTTFHRNYQNMIRSFRIYAYTLPPIATDSLSSSFASLILSSPFLTGDPEEAHLFFLPFPSLPTRSLARAVKELRATLPFWNRTLGADHFHLSASGLAFESDRNLVELKKNSVQLSPFPAPPGRFIPHKDLTLPPNATSHAPPPANRTRPNLCYAISASENDAGCLDAPDESEDLAGSEFCVFGGEGDFMRLAHALGAGCVPVVVTERPMQDLPLMDMVRWEEIALFVRPRKGLRGVLERAREEGACGKMRRLGVEASRHFVWNDPPQQFDAFYMVMYQLWLRRHTIRYARREFL